MQYMHIQSHTCMRQSRWGGVFGGLWQTLYVSGSDETSPIGWDGSWDRVYKLGSILVSYPAERGGGGSGTSDGGGGGGARNRVFRGDKDGGKKCLRPWPGVPWVRPAGCRRRRRSLWDAVVILVPVAAIEANTRSYIQYRQIHTIHTIHAIQTHTYIA